MASFWREVLDLSEEAQTPARTKAARQVGLVLGVLGAATLLILGVLSNWSSPVLTPLGSLTLLGLGMVIGSSLRVYRARRARAHARRPAEPGADC